MIASRAPFGSTSFTAPAQPRMPARAIRRTVPIHARTSVFTAQIIPYAACERVIRSARMSPTGVPGSQMTGAVPLGPNPISWAPCPTS